MPFEAVLFGAWLRDAPGTPWGPWPRVDMLTCEMSWPTPGGAVSRGAAFAAAADTMTLAASALITAKRRNALISPPSRIPENIVQIVPMCERELQAGRATRP